MRVHGVAPERPVPVAEHLVQWQHRVMAEVPMRGGEPNRPQALNKAALRHVEGLGAHSQLVVGLTVTRRLTFEKRLCLFRHGQAARPIHEDSRPGPSYEDLIASLEHRHRQLRVVPVCMGSASVFGLAAGWRWEGQVEVGMAVTRACSFRRPAGESVASRPRSVRSGTRRARVRASCSAARSPAAP